MKRLLFFVFILALSLPLSAQSGDQIVLSVASKAERNIKCSFTEAHKDVAGKTSNLAGTLEYLKGKDYLSMKYTNGDTFLIDGNSMTINKGGKTTVFDTSKNLMMKSLRNLLLNSFKGSLKEISQENDTELLATVQGGAYVVNFMAKKKLPRGYSRITVVYDASTCAIRSIEMVEVTGNVILYKI